MTLEEFTSDFLSPSPFLEVKTSGSTGTPKQLLVEKSRMRASARMTCNFLNLSEGDSALLCMPLDYIAGKMMVVRAIERNLRLISMEPTGHPFKDISTRVQQEGIEALAFAAIVPLQLHNTLLVPEEKDALMQIRHVIVGGGAISDEMEKQLRTFPNAIWSTYGMTETLSHVAMRRLSGEDATEWYTPMPGVNLSQDKDGCLIIDAPTLNPETLHTNDIVQLHENGTFRILGRRDNVICSGGVKLQIEEMERELAQYLSFPFVVTKAKDEKFGEIAVLLTEGSTTQAEAEIPELSNKYFRPKKILHIDKLPQTETGKPARARAMEIASKLILEK